eukprot:UN17907
MDLHKNNKIDAIDIDKGQIENGKKLFGSENVNWICDDVLTHKFDHKYDFISAVWLHNFLHTEIVKLPCSNR